MSGSRLLNERNGRPCRLPLALAADLQNRWPDQNEQLMILEVFDVLEPVRTLLFDTGEQRVAAIVDGSGSWGSGREGADLARDSLNALWPRPTWSTSVIANDVSAVVAQTPTTLREDDFGCSFSVVVLLCSKTLVQIVACGFYRVDVVSVNKRENLFRPMMLVDQLLASGAITRDQVPAFPHQGVCV